MNGRNHVLIGATAWLAATPWLLASGITTGRQAMVGTLTAAGAALLPDVDHRNSTIAHTLGPVTKLLTRTVSKLSGGHRHATHSLVFVIACVAATTASVERWPEVTLAVIVGVCGAWALHLLGPHHLRSAEIPAAAAAAVAAWWTVHHVPAGPWLVWSVGIGCVAHLAADGVTHGKFPLLWPIPWRMTLPIIDTGSAFERALTPILSLTVIALAVRLSSTLP